MRLSVPKTVDLGEALCRQPGRSMQVAVAMSMTLTVASLFAAHAQVDNEAGASLLSTRIVLTSRNRVPESALQLQFNMMSSVPAHVAVMLSPVPAATATLRGMLRTRSLSSVRWESAVIVATSSTVLGPKVTVAATTMDGTDNAIPMLSGRIQKSFGNLDIFENSFVKGARRMAGQKG
jgi:hypothetical protein